jgi:hypothetical protein
VDRSVRPQAVAAQRGLETGHRGERKKTVDVNMIGGGGGGGGCMKEYYDGR